MENRTSIHPDPCSSGTVTKKKRKSPSTIKRDRARWQRWQARRKEQGTYLYRSRPGSETPDSGNSISQNSSTDPAPHQDPEAAASPLDLNVDKENTTSHVDLDSGGTKTLLEKPTGVAQPLPGTHCFNCEKPKHLCPDGLKKCTQCFHAFYCGRVCQGLDWHRHRQICKLFTGSTDK